MADDMNPEAAPAPAPRPAPMVMVQCITERRPWATVAGTARPLAFDETAEIPRAEAERLAKARLVLIVR